MEEVIPQKKRSNDSANCCDPPKILPPHLTGGYNVLSKKATEERLNLTGRCTEYNVAHIIRPKNYIYRLL